MKHLKLVKLAIFQNYVEIVDTRERAIKARVEIEMERDTNTWCLFRDCNEVISYRNMHL